MANETKILITANTANAEAAMARLGHSLSGVTKNILSFGGVAGTLSGALSITAFAGFIKSSIDAADRLGDLSKSTGVAVEQLAGLQLAAKQSGSDLESIAQSLNKLSINLAKGGEKFAELGITAKDPIEALKQLSDLFVRIEDPQQRAAVAAELLGKSWAGTAPLLAEGGQRIGEMIEKGKRLSGITAEMTQEADAFNDSLEELKTQASGTGISLANTLLPQMNQIILAMREASKEGSLLKTVWVGLGGLGAAVFTDQLLSEEQQISKRLAKLKSEQSTGLLGRIAGPLLHPIDTIRGASLNAPSSAERAAEITRLQAQLESLQKQRLAAAAGATKTAGLSTAEQKAIDALLKPVKATGRTGGGARTDPIAQIRAQEQATLLALKKEVDGYNDLTKVAQIRWEIEFGAYKKFSPLVQEELLTRAKIVDGIESQGEATKALAEYNKMVESVFTGAQEDFNKKLQDAYDILSDVDIVFRAGQEWEKLLKIQAQFPEIISMEQIGQKYAQLFDTHKDTLDEMSEYAKQAGRNIQDAFAEFLFDPFNSNLGGLVQNFEMALRKMAAQALSSHILDWVGSWGESQSGEGGIMGFFGNLLGDMFGGGKAIGGAVNPGTTYLVGERGPELFRPANAGSIIPNGKFGGGVTVVNNFTLAQPADRRTMEQIGALAGLSIQTAMARNT